MVRLRRYVSADFDALHALDQACFEQGIAYSEQELAFFLMRESAISIVAEDDVAQPTIVGFVIADLSRPRSGHIITIDVAGSSRRQQVGSTLIEAAEAEIQRSGRAAVLLEVAVENLAARRFYEKHGYSALRELRDYYRRGGHAVLMGKNL